MGPPDKVEELGETEIPEDVLTDYLFDLSPQFTSVLTIYTLHNHAHNVIFYVVYVVIYTYL